MSANSKELDLDVLINVKLTPDDTKKFKKFAALLNQLSMFISSSGTSYKVEHDLRKVCDKIKFEKVIYLHNKTLYSEVNDTVNELSVKHLKHELDAPSIKFQRHLKEILVKSEVRQKLPCLRSKLLGLSAQEGNLLGLDTLQPVKPLTSSEKTYLVNHIQEKLQERRQDFSSFYETLDGIQNGRSLKNMQENSGPFTKNLPFSSLLESKKDQYEENRMRLMWLMVRYQKLLWDNYNMLTEKNRLMTELGEICSSYELDTKKIKALAVQSDVINLKLRLSHLKILTELYNSDVLQAHTKIKHYITEALMKCESEKVLAVHSLTNYESAGPRFHTLIKDLNELKNQIENKRWILSKLNTQNQEYP